MKIIITGAGSVGFNLASELAREGYDIAVIDHDADRIRKIQDKLDVLAVQGNATDVRVLEASGIRGADLLIAVTDRDELNQVVCMMAHSFGVLRKIARVRNRSFSGKNPVVSRAEFHINRVINPDDITVNHILDLVEIPGATETGDFAQGDILLRAVHLKEKGGILGKPLVQLKTEYAKLGALLVAAIKRNGKIIIPSGDDYLDVGDLVYVIMTRDLYPRFRKLMGADAARAHKVIISGAGRIGLEVARRLEGVVESLVVLDEDGEVCNTASAELKNALVFKGQPTDEEIVREVHFENADFFIAALEDDRLNLVNALLAKKEGAKRTVVLTQDLDLVPILESLDIDAVINSRLIMVGEIVRFVLPGKILTVQKLGDGEAEIIEVVVDKTSRAVGAALRDMHLPKGSIVGAVQRQGKAFVPNGSTVVEVGDHIVAFVLPDVREKIQKYFAGKQRTTSLSLKGK